MKEELAGPGVEHAGDAKLGAEPTRVTAELEECFCRAGEEHVEAQCAVGEHYWAELRGKGEDDVEGMSGQDALHAALEPAGLG
jgi:hypothetical protein